MILSNELECVDDDDVNRKGESTNGMRDRVCKNESNMRGKNTRCAKFEFAACAQ